MSGNDRYVQTSLSEEVPSTSAGSGQIQGMGVGDKGEPGVKKTTYKMKNAKTTLKRLKEQPK